MKLSDGFDARRLRPRPSKSWRLRLGILFGLLLALSGVLVAVVGGLSLVGMDAKLGSLAVESEGGIALLLVGLLLAWIGWISWRRCSFRLRQPGGLSLAPHLFRRRG